LRIIKTNNGGEFIMTRHEIEQQTVDIIDISFNGRILDIGGGGEGIISRHSGDKVVAIDAREDELKETPDIGLKIIMDACDLKFLDNSFENISCFFSLMYMNENQVIAFLKEAKRVLKNNGKLWIWDVTIPSKKSADVIIAQLKIKISTDEIITTGYGVQWVKSQSLESVRKLCVDEGFCVESEDLSNQTFFLCLQLNHY